VTRNEKKQTISERELTVLGTEQPKVPSPLPEPKKATFTHSLVAFVKILAAAGGITLLIWFIDKNIS
jgi:hypothetical protein